MSTQTEKICSSKLISNDQTYMTKLLSVDKEIQCELNDETADIKFNQRANILINSKSKMKYFNSSSSSSVSLPFMKQNLISRFKEFNSLSKIKCLLANTKLHPGTLFLNKFCETFNSPNSKVIATSVKVLIKTINQIYNEKMQASKDSAQIQIQTLLEFMYDFFVNKYGLINSAEKKLTELLASVTRNCQIPKIELFARFIGLGSQLYSPDDLDFLFVISMIYQNSIFGYNYKKDYIAFDAIQNSNIKNAYELITKLFTDKTSPERINQVIKELKENQNKKLPEDSIDIHIIYMSCINLYKEIKNDLFIELFEGKSYPSNYSGIIIGSKDIESIMPKVKHPTTATKEMVEIFFNTFSSKLTNSGKEESGKRLPLEYILSFLFTKIQLLKNY